MTSFAPLRRAAFWLLWPTSLLLWTCGSFLPAFLMDLLRVAQGAGLIALTIWVSSLLTRLEQALDERNGQWWEKRQ